MTHAITRVRHELRRRTLTVAAIETLSPAMLRLHFTSPDLGDFPSVGFDDHVKLFIPGTAAPGERGTMRDFTPRAFDRSAGTIQIDFARHDGGPAIAWAVAACVGDTIEIGGPRGSAVIADDFDWYWLIGDLSGLPAIGRRLGELREGVPVTTMVLVETPADAQPVATVTRWTAHWIEPRGRDDATALTEAVGRLTLPSGEGHVWIAAEATAARAVRAAVEALGQPRQWIKAAGYWQRGEEGAHIRIED